MVHVVGATSVVSLSPTEQCMGGGDMQRSPLALLTTTVLLLTISVRTVDTYIPSSSQQVKLVTFPAILRTHMCVIGRRREDK